MSGVRFCFLFFVVVEWGGAHQLTLGCGVGRSSPTNPWVLLHRERGGAGLPHRGVPRRAPVELWPIEGRVVRGPPVAMCVHCPIGIACSAPACSHGNRHITVVGSNMKPGEFVFVEFHFFIVRLRPRG